MSAICEELGIKRDTVKKAIYQKRLVLPRIRQSIEVATTKTQRNIQDDIQILGKGCTNVTSRVLSAFTGEASKIEFANSIDVQHAGVLISIPALISQGLLRYESDFDLVNAYYPTSSIFLSLAILSLLRIKTLSGVSSLPAGELGKALGLDRIPEVKTLRGRIARFCKKLDIREWSGKLSADWLSAFEELEAILYIDGHVNLYYGKDFSLPKRYVSRMRLSLSGTTDYWVNDALGQPFLVINKTINEGLIQNIKKEILPRLDKDIPSQPSELQLDQDKYLHRYMLVFDREGYSPDFFHDLWQERISIATYKKNVKDKWADEEFTIYTEKLPYGTSQTIELAERGVLLENKKSKKKIWAREIRKKTKSGHQTTIITTNYKIPILLVGLYMFARWAQENFFKYMIQDFGIDTLVSYQKNDIPASTLLVNPKYRQLENQRKSLTSKLNTRKAKFGSITLKEQTLNDKEMEKYLVRKQELKEEIEQLEKEIETIKTEKKKVPYKIQFSELPEPQKFKNVINDRKHFLDTIKIIAYRAETSLANQIKNFMAHKDEARLLLKKIYKSDANLKVDKINNKLIVEIHRLPYWKDDRILEKLCTILNDTQTKFPDTNLTIFYKLVSA